MGDTPVQKPKKKRILYLSNIEVPYRVRFFNELAKEYDLTVLYERVRSKNRNVEWSSGEKSTFNYSFLNGIKIGNENSFSPYILKYIKSDYDMIIVGCYNSPVQMFAILMMRLLKIPYLINLDGEVFLTGKGLKTKLKKFFLSKAKGYLVAGEKAALSIKSAFAGENIYPYYFSSLSDNEILEHSKASISSKRNDNVLVVGQYFDYKGLDVALEAAKQDLSVKYLFVGTGLRTEKFMSDHLIPENVEIIPFLQKNELKEQYLSCGMMVLPSRQECWGLAVNEAASFGLPIVSTWGCGAAVEFLSDEYSQYLAQSGDAKSLLKCIHRLRKDENKKEYSEFLISKSVCYSIEKSVEIHKKCLQQEGN